MPIVHPCEGLSRAAVKKTLFVDVTRFAPPAAAIGCSDSDAGLGIGLADDDAGRRLICI